MLHADLKRAVHDQSAAKGAECQVIMGRSRCQISKLLAENPLVCLDLWVLTKSEISNMEDIMIDWNARPSLDTEKRTYTVYEIAAILNIGRTSAYQLVKEKHFKTIRIGNAIRISKKSFDKWLDSLEL